jgi:hypothetical protein
MPMALSGIIIKRSKDMNAYTKMQIDILKTGSPDAQSEKYGRLYEIGNLYWVVLKYHAYCIPKSEFCLDKGIFLDGCGGGGLGQLLENHRTADVVLQPTGAMKLVGRRTLVQFRTGAAPEEPPLWLDKSLLAKFPIGQVAIPSAELRPTFRFAAIIDSTTGLCYGVIAECRQ